MSELNKKKITVLQLIIFYFIIAAIITSILIFLRLEFNFQFNKKTVLADNMINMQNDIKELEIVEKPNKDIRRNDGIRIISKKDVGLTLINFYKNNKLVEVQSQDLIGEFLGQTGPKTQAVIESALDGVLFIDEAYTLAVGNNMDYGNEAIATLLKRMEDDRDRLVVVLAGYPHNMHQFIDSNPGLQSRFNRYIEFEDYSVKELEDIFILNVKKNDYEMSSEALIELREVLTRAVSRKDEKFGNARYVRNLFEKTIERQANRLSKTPNVSDDKLLIIESIDIIE